VPLADRLAGELDRHHQRSRYQADDDLVFAHPHRGGPLDGSKLRKRFKAALARAGVREVRFHDLRHTFGTRMAAQGVPARTLQEWMGHASLVTTEIYADYSPSTHEADWIEAAFRVADPPEIRGATRGAKQ
jgi:integrase